MTAGDLPASAGIGRVGLTVDDLGDCLAFYRDVVGLAVRSRADDAAVLGDPDTALLELRADPELDPRPETTAGLFHTAVRVPSRAALGDALGRIREGWRLSGASDHLVSEALYLRDPEGNGVEIYRDRPREEWPLTDDGRVEMVTDPLDLDDVAGESTGDPSVPAGTDVGHVHLEVTGLAGAREYYADALGTNVRQEMSGALFLAAGEYHHHVGCNVWNRRSDPAAGHGLDWFEVVVPDRALAGVRDRFERAGLAVTDPNGDPDPVTALDGDGDGDGFAVTDPDGVELRVRPEGGS
jgi:catechol 2,3-dioxygenase